MSLLFIILLSTATLFMQDMIIMWFVLEASNFTFLFMMTLEMKNKKVIFIYYIIQMISSSLIIISTLINFSLLSPISSPTLTSMMMISLMMKIGIPPLHFWFPMVSMYMKWNLIIILFTLMKVIPFIIMALSVPHSSLQTLCVMLCLVIPPFSMLNSTNLKKLLSYSSINQSGWMIMIIYSFSSLWLIYMVVYTISLLAVTNLIGRKKMKFNMSAMSFRSLDHNILTLLSMMNLSGIPPMMLFIFKWYAVTTLIALTGPNIIILLMLISSLAMMYMYMNMLMKISLLNISMPKLKPIKATPSPPEDSPETCLIIIIFMFSAILMIIL